MYLAWFAHNTRCGADALVTSGVDKLITNHFYIPNQTVPCSSRPRSRPGAGARAVSPVSVLVLNLSRVLSV